MAVIKMSIAGAPTNINLSQFLGNNDNELGAHTFYINSDIKECDVWIVMDNLDRKKETCVTLPGGLVFVTAEVLADPAHFEDSAVRMAFLRQFDHVYTCHDIFLETVHSSPPFLPWMVNANHGSSISAPHQRDVNFLRGLDRIEKRKSLSVFCSAKAGHPSHRMRLNFVRKLKEHFGSELDWFGNGVNEVSEKWQGLAPYKYSLVLENHSATNVITEKLLDCYLTLTFPIYWGAPNVSDYFPSESYTPIDAKDINGSIDVIEELLRVDPYEDRHASLIEARDIVLNDFMYLHRLGEIVDEIVDRSGRLPKVERTTYSLRAVAGVNPSALSQHMRRYSSAGLRRLAQKIQID